VVTIEVEQQRKSQETKTEALGLLFVASYHGWATRKPSTSS
jgi:hypothetical protein